jgi:hypothetical protein
VRWAVAICDRSSRVDAWMRDPDVTLQAATCESLVRRHTYYEW